MNEYGITLGAAGWRYLQQELSRELGLSWSDVANWHGVLRIRIDIQADDRAIGDGPIELGRAP